MAGLSFRKGKLWQKEGQGRKDLSERNGGKQGSGHVSEPLCTCILPVATYSESRNHAATVPALSSMDVMSCPAHTCAGGEARPHPEDGCWALASLWL